MLRGKDVQDIEELKRQGLSIRAISGLTGNDRKTIRKYLIQPQRVSVLAQRANRDCGDITLVDRGCGSGNPS